MICLPKKKKDQLSKVLSVMSLIILSTVSSATDCQLITQSILKLLITTSLIPAVMKQKTFLFH